MVSLVLLVSSKKTPHKKKVLTITTQTTIDDFFEQSQAILGHKCFSVTIERQKEKFLVLNRKSLSLYLPTYLLHHGDHAIFHESLNPYFKDTISSTEINLILVINGNYPEDQKEAHVHAKVSPRSCPVIPLPNFPRLVEPIHGKTKYVIIGTMLTGKCKVIKLNFSDFVQTDEKST